MKKEPKNQNTAVAHTTKNALVADGENPWLEVSTELDKFIGALFLKFSKTGEFVIGNDIDIIPDGTRCLVQANAIEFGWKKWMDGRPVEARMGRVSDKFIPAQRRDLDDSDKSQWEHQDNGKRRDSWQFTMSVPVKRLDTGEIFCFSTNSKGGLACINKLLKDYGNRIAEGASGTPIVELKAESYKHREYGKIFIPTMPVVGWVGDDGKPIKD